MNPELSPSQKLNNLDRQLFRFRCGMIEQRRINNLNFKQQYKEELLEKAKFPIDPELREKVGTPDYLIEAVDTVWDVYKDKIDDDFSRRESEGKVQRLKNYMSAEDEDKRIPDLDTLVRWADDIRLPTLMLDPILVAAGYEKEANEETSNELLKQRYIGLFALGFKAIQERSHRHSTPILLGKIGMDIAKGSLRNFFRRK
jgi:hypothetical protein